MMHTNGMCRQLFTSEAWNGRVDWVGRKLLLGREAECLSPDVSEQRVSVLSWLCCCFYSVCLQVVACLMKQCMLSLHTFSEYTGELSGMGLQTESQLSK